ncbi:MAG: SDR family oxidoreductase [Pseudomonadota bacterium]
MGKRLTGKRVVVTAAAQGIGRAVAERALEEGAEVYASDLNEAGLAGLDGALCAKLDGTDHDAVAAYIAGLPGLDGVVHAVGYVHQGTLMECGPEDWRRTMTITLDSAYHLLHAALPRLMAQGGSIVTIASVVSSIKGLPKRAAYGAAKAGVIGLTKSVAADYLRHGIRANAVCPGTVETPSLHERIDALAEEFGSREKAMAFFLDRQPTGRMGTAAEIAGLCAYLLADESALITGQALSIDGGITV